MKPIISRNIPLHLLQGIKQLLQAACSLRGGDDIAAKKQEASGSSSSAMHHPDSLSSFAALAGPPSADVLSQQMSQQSVEAWVVLGSAADCDVGLPRAGMGPATSVLSLASVPAPEDDTRPAGDAGVSMPADIVFAPLATSASCRRLLLVLKL